MPQPDLVAQLRGPARAAAQRLIAGAPRHDDDVAVLDGLRHAAERIDRLEARPRRLPGELTTSQRRDDAADLADRMLGAATGLGRIFRGEGFALVVFQPDEAAAAPQFVGNVELPAIGEVLRRAIGEVEAQAARDAELEAVIRQANVGAGR
jgi:hypothetical protein